MIAAYVDEVDIQEMEFYCNTVRERERERGYSITARP
jgi:hypothetical protein